MTALRRSGIASVAVLIGLLPALALVHASAPDWSRRNGLDVWNLGAALREQRAAAEERADVNAHGERFAQRRAAAQQVTAKLSANAITLSAAVDELMAVFEHDAGIRSTLEGYPTAPTVRHAIDRVRALLADDPNRADVLARLEIEYRALGPAPASPARREKQTGP